MSGRSAAELLDWLARGEGSPPAAVILVAHPDDETIGCGALLPRLVNPTIVHLTDGAPRDLWFARKAGCATREAYAARRLLELEAALTLAGIRPSQRVAFGAIDQEAALSLVRLTRAFFALAGRLGPELILTHPYEGGHPDHDAAAFVAQAACRLLEQAGAHRPATIEMAFYQRGPDGDEAPRWGEFLAGADVRAIAVPLSPSERARKQAMIACFATQAEVLSPVPVSVEKYRIAPPYDWSAAPHAGHLQYERWGWPLDGARFRSLAAEASRELGLSRG